MEGQVWLTMADHSEAELCALEEWQILDTQTAGRVSNAAITEAVVAAGHSRAAAKRAVVWLNENGYRDAGTPIPKS